MLFLTFWVSASASQDLRLALWHVTLKRDGPGILLRDLLDRDPGLVAIADALAAVDADIIVLTQIDHDATGAALRELAAMVDPRLAHAMPLRTNAGIPTGQDMDADGRLGEPEDMQAFGRFPGQGALGVLSRFPIKEEATRSFNDILWRDLPGTHMTKDDPGQGVQRVSSGGHWIVPVLAAVQDPRWRLDVFVGHAGAPVFDGPEDRNGRRNLDELRLWEQILDAQQTESPNQALVFMVNTNLDPDRGEGYRDAMQAFLENPRLQDPLPGLATAEWDNPGPMRVSYLLPSSDLRILDAKLWPALPGQPHRLITVDIALPAMPLP